MEHKEKLYICIHFPQSFFEPNEIEGGDKYAIDEICKHLFPYRLQHHLCIGRTKYSKQNISFFEEIQKRLSTNNDLQNEHLLSFNYNLTCHTDDDGYHRPNILIVVDETGVCSKQFLSKAKSKGITTIVIPCKKILSLKPFILFENGIKEEVQLIKRYSYSVHYEYKDVFTYEIMDSGTTLVYPEDEGIGLLYSEGKYRFHTLHRGHWYYCTDYEELLKHINVSSETELYNIIKKDVLDYVANPTAPIKDKEY